MHSEGTPTHIYAQRMIMGASYIPLKSLAKLSLILIDLDYSLQLLKVKNLKVK